MNQEVFSALSEALQRGEEVALVTITSSTGSTPQRVGAKMLVYADGRTVGTIGGGCYENEAFWKAREAIKTRKPINLRYELNDDFAQENGLVWLGLLHKDDDGGHRTDASTVPIELLLNARLG